MNDTDSAQSPEKSRPSNSTPEWSEFDVKGSLERFMASYVTHCEACSKLPRDRKGAIMRLGATLYLNGSVEAVDFYMKAFGLVVGYNEKNPDGTYLHAELTKDGKEIFAVSESPRHPIVDDMLRSAWPTMSYRLDFDDDASLEHAYDAVIEGGHVLRPLGSLPWNRLSADVVDRFGVYWYICLGNHAQVEAKP